MSKNCTIKERNKRGDRVEERERRSRSFNALKFLK